MYRLAQVTDPHFQSFAGAHVGDFFGKRAVGALNLVLNRRRHHKMDLLAALADDLRAHPPDHLALTGDLSNVSLEGEWQTARAWIDALDLGPAAVTVIPGNHDSYVPSVVASRVFEQTFAPFQTADFSLPTASSPPAFYPFVRLRGPLALVAASSAVATGDLGAWGLIGADQLGRLEAALTAPAVAARVRMLLLHHPPVQQKGGEDRNLKDRDALAAMLARAGADIVIHGHDHRDERATLPGPGGRAIPVVGAGSASYAGGPDRRARYNVYEIDDDRGITLAVRAHDETAACFREVSRERLA